MQVDPGYFRPLNAKVHIFKTVSGMGQMDIKETVTEMISTVYPLLQTDWNIPVSDPGFALQSEELTDEILY